RIVSNHVGGQRYIGYDHRAYYSITKDEEIAVLNRLQTIQKEEKELLDQLAQDVLSSTDDLIACCNTSKPAIRNVLPLIGEPDKFIDFISKERKKAKYIPALFSDWLDKIDAIERVQEQLTTEVSAFANILYKIAIQASERNITQYKERNSVLTFNDMIVKLHAALTRKSNTNLTTGLQTKYKAVFIDEFQDTDKLQYDIFKSAFGSETVI